MENRWNLRVKPWSDAVGIEEDDPNAEPPAIVCWFTRGRDSEEEAREVVRLHNQNLKEDD